MNRVYYRKGITGSTNDFQVRRRSANGGLEPDAGSYTGDEALTVLLYPGAGLAPITTLSASWIDAANAEIRLDPIGADALSDVTPGVYEGHIQLADAGVDLIIFELVVEQQMGSSEARPTYISASNILEEFPVDEARLAKTEYDATGFEVIRAKARDWLDLNILSSYRPYTGRTVRSTPRGWDIPGASPENNKWLSDALADGALMLDTSNGRRLKAAMIYWCLGKILRRAVGRSSASDNLLDLADHYDAKAASILMTSVAELDTDGDGMANYTVSFRTTNTRRG